MKNATMLSIIIIVLVVWLSGCNEDAKARRSAVKAKMNALKIFHSKSLSSLTCENIDHQYERCSEYSWYNEVEFCQSKYTPVLMRCYGIKSN